MAIPTETLYRMNRLNVWFAASSVLMMASIVWMVWVDYKRPWHQYQYEYMDTQASLSHLNYLVATSEKNQEDLRRAEQAVDEAEKLVEQEDQRRRKVAEKLAEAEAAGSGEVAALRAEFEAAPTREYLEEQINESKLTLASADIKFNQISAVIQVTAAHYEEMLTAHGAEAPETHKAKEEVENQQTQLEEVQSVKEKHDDRVMDLTAKLKELDEPVTAARRVHAAAVKQAEDLQKKVAQTEDSMVRKVINAPFLDFVAPPTTPSRLRVQQLVLPEVKQRLNYLESYTTDRCTTCHIAIDNPDFQPDRLASMLETAIPAINEQRRMKGQADIAFPAVPKLEGDDAPKLTEGQVTGHWDDLGEAQRKEYLDLLLQSVNGYLEAEDRPTIKLEQPLLAHPDLDLFVNIDSPHPMKEVGCTVCHEGNPQETDFVLAAHTPKNHAQEHEWAEEYYVRRLGLPTATFALVEHYWDRPMLLSKYSEAGCVKCHTKVADIGKYDEQPQGRNINMGEDLFVNSGCINCHLVEGKGDSRRVGPELTRIAAKLTPGFTDQWIYNPRAFRPTTWMPHFFVQENNGHGSENEFDPHPVLRTETEAMAIRTYLFALSDEWYPEPIPDGLTGDAEKGKTLFKAGGCLGCHSNVHEFGESWITEHMQKRAGQTAEQAKADFNAMSLNERVQYAWDHFASDREANFFPDDIRFDSEADYNVPVLTRFAPELSAVGSKVSVEWLYAWLRDPHAYAPDTKMPSMRLTEQEALDIATYLATLQHDEFKANEIPLDDEHRKQADGLVFDILASQRSERRTKSIMADEGGELTDMLTSALAKSPVARLAEQRIASMDLETKRLVFLGSKMISHYGCYACHLIPGYENATRPGTDLTTWAEKPISQLDFAFFSPAFDEIREKKPQEYEYIYPKDRDDLITLAHGNDPQEITHTHASFAYHKMRNPRIWDRNKIKKPYDKLKMPNFYLSEIEADALVTYLLGRRAPRVADSLKIDYDGSNLGAIANGRLLTRQMNCVGCHQIEDNVAAVQQYFRNVIGGSLYFDEVNAPPSLRGEGAKVQHWWLAQFFHNVEMLRPWLKVRMPSFDLTTDQSETLVRYFAALSNYESEELTEKLKPVLAYVHSSAQNPEAKAGELAGEGDASEPATGSDWFRKFEPAAKFLGRYALRNRMVGPFELVEEGNTEEKLAEAYGKVLKGTEFLGDLYEVPYPFDRSARLRISQERFEKGEGLLLELGCLKCHVLGDPAVEGSNPNPSAPNLDLAFSRLRPGWVDSWMRNPAWIQPGTKMPALFPSPAGAFVDFGELRAELEQKYGASSDEQISLLIDYIYDAGQRRHTAIQPGLVFEKPGETGDEFKEEGEEFEEEEEFIDDE